MRKNRSVKMPDTNMKDIFLKVKERVSFRSRLFIAIAISILLLTLGGGIYSAALTRNSDQSERSSHQLNATDLDLNDNDIAEIAEVLPQQIRSNEDYEDSEEQSWSYFNPVVDPFGGPMKLTGVLIGGWGGAMAIVESSGTSYIVSEGDYVDDLWAVREITRNSVIMRANNQEVSLFLDQPPIIRDLNLDLETENDDSEEGA